MNTPAQFDVGAEQALLGALLLSNEAVEEVVARRLTAAEFYKPAHGTVFAAIISLYGAGEPIDAVTVASELKNDGLLEAVGGKEVLVDYQAETPAVGNAKSYAAIIADHALRRQLLQVGAEIVETSQSGHTPEAALDASEAALFALRNQNASNATTPVSEALAEMLDVVEERHENGGEVVGAPTGYVDLDKDLSGLQPGALYIVGARPAMGKTAFALGIAGNIAFNEKQPALVFSLEMSTRELTERLASTYGLIDNRKLKSGQLTDSDWTKLTKVTTDLAKAPFYIHDQPGMSIMDIRAAARRLKRKTGNLGVIVVDYLQLLTGRNSAESRQVEVAEISRQLKNLARELETPVVALSQLNRGLEQRIDKRPVLSDLRESGSLEQDADVVLFLYRDEIYNEASEHKGVAEVIVAKHRNGPTGKTRLAFRGQYTRFENMAMIRPEVLAPDRVPAWSDNG